jgi:hypothetical protein
MLDPNKCYSRKEISVFLDFSERKLYTILKAQSIGQPRKLLRPRDIRQLLTWLGIPFAPPQINKNNTYSKLPDLPTCKPGRFVFGLAVSGFAEDCRRLPIKCEGGGGSFVEEKSKIMKMFISMMWCVLFLTGCVEGQVDSKAVTTDKNTIKDSLAVVQDGPSATDSLSKALCRMHMYEHYYNGLGKGKTHIEYLNKSGIKTTKVLEKDIYHPELFWHGPIILLNDLKIQKCLIRNKLINVGTNANVQGMNYQNDTILSKMENYRFMKALKQEYNVKVSNISKIKYIVLRVGMNDLKPHGVVHDSAITYTNGYSMMYSIDFLGSSVDWGPDTTYGRVSVIVMRDCHFAIKNIVTMPNKLIDYNYKIDVSGNYILYHEMTGSEAEGEDYGPGDYFLYNVKNKTDVRLPIRSNMDVDFAYFTDGYFQFYDGDIEGKSVVKYYISPYTRTILSKTIKNPGLERKNDKIYGFRKSFQTYGQSDDLSSFQSQSF